MRVTILSISAAGEDHTALRKLLRGFRCRLATATTCRVGLQLLGLTQISIVVCERQLPDGTWLDILNDLDGRMEKPLLIVTSRFADEALWAEVLNLGGFDVIAKPFDTRGARHVLETAYLRQHNQNGVRARQVLAAAAT
jgi:DNA-binding response OmpR family regulator